MADRRKQQNFTHLPHYLTQEIWGQLATQPREKTTSLLIGHCWDLGLRCPTEATFGMMYNVLTLANPDQEPARSSFERYTEIGSLKQRWKEYRTAKKEADFKYGEYLMLLPRNVRDLPAEYYLAAFHYSEAVPPRSSVLNG